MRGSEPKRKQKREQNARRKTFLLPREWRIRNKERRTKGKRAQEKRRRVESKLEALRSLVLAVFHRSSAYFCTFGNALRFLFEALTTLQATSSRSRREKLKNFDARESAPRAFLPFSIITGPQLRSISGYFKLLSRCAVPAGRRNFAECLLGEISSARSKTNSSSSSLALDERRHDDGRRWRSVAILSAVVIRLRSDFMQIYEDLFSL